MATMAIGKRAKDWVDEYWNWGGLVGSLLIFLGVVWVFFSFFGEASIQQDTNLIPPKFQEVKELPQNYQDYLIVIDQKGLKAILIGCQPAQERRFISVANLIRKGLIFSRPI